MQKPSAARKLTKWSIELSDFDVNTSPPLQSRLWPWLVFLAELTPKIPVKKEEWKIFVDDSINNQSGGIGIVVKGPCSQKIEYAGHFSFAVTNNEAEYEAFIAWLWIAKILNIEKLVMLTDSLLVAKQSEGSFCQKNQELKHTLMRHKKVLNIGQMLV